MRILLIGKSASYLQIIQDTAAAYEGSLTVLDYAQVGENLLPAPLVFVIAEVGSTQGLDTGRAILQQYPGSALVFLMPECCFEFSMLAMRMGAKNILVGDEINAASIGRIIQQYAAQDTLAQSDNISRYFECLVFSHNDEEQKLSARALNRLFSLKENAEQYYVAMVTGVDFCRKQIREGDAIAKKISNERVRTHLQQLNDEVLRVRFVFYIEQMFYIILSLREDPRRQEQERVRYIQEKLFRAGSALLGERQIVLCSKGRDDFGKFKLCLDELELQKSVMHNGKYPCMLDAYRCRKVSHDPQISAKLMNGAMKAVKLVEEGGDYEEAIEALFSASEMRSVSFTQFMKLKEYLSFELQLLYQQLDKSLPEYEQIGEDLETLQSICTCGFACETVLKITKQLVACSQKHYNHLISQCIHFISEHYATDMGLYETARHLNISSVYLSTLFRKETGKKFSVYVNEFRLKKAKDLLDSGEQPLSKIYELVGFSNQQYFSNCFKKTYGMTPSEYRKKRHK